MKRIISIILALAASGYTGAFAQDYIQDSNSASVIEESNVSESEFIKNAGDYELYGNNEDENYDEIELMSDTAPANVELFYPKRVSLYAPDGYDNANLTVNNGWVIDDDNYITGRRIVNTTSASQTNAALRFRTNDYIYGSRRWKNNFTWEFDFKVDTLVRQFIMTIGGSRIKFAKDSQTNQYYLSWEGTSIGISHPMSIIWGHKDNTLCAYGKTYHLRIDVDSAMGGNIITTFSDAESGYINTSSQPNGLSNSMENYAIEGKIFTFNFSAVEPVDITTSNELMYYDEYFILSKKIEAEESIVKASVALMNCVNNPSTAERSVPYLFIGVYDKNGALVKMNGINKAIVPKHASADNEFLTAEVDYSTDADISALSDGEYKVKLCLWQSQSEMIVGTDMSEKTITIKDGKIE